MKKIKTLSSCILLLSLLTACGRASAPVEEVVTDTSSEVQEVATAPFEAALTVTAFKAGAADAFVLKSPNHVAIIDAGLDKKGDKLVDSLKQQGITRIDELIITHFDKDHVGGADHVINNFEVDKVYTTYQSKDSDDITQYLKAMESKGLTQTTVTGTLTWEADGVTYTIYPPQKTSYIEKESNNSSLVIRVVNGEYSMLFAGDAEAERIEELLATKGLESTILKVPHHGRTDVNTQRLIDYISPEYAIITSSKSEPEDQAVLDILSKGNVKTYLTREGQVTMILDKDGVTITQ